MISKKSPIWKFTPALLTIAFGSTVVAQNRTGSTATVKGQQESAATVPDSLDWVDKAAELETLRARMDDASSLLRGQALTAMDASATLDAETTSGLLRDALEDKDPLVAETALRALVRRGDDELPRLREVDLEKFSGENAELASVLLSTSNKDVAALRELMKNGDAQVQQAAFEELAANDTTEAIDALKAEFSDPASVHRLQTLELFLRSPYTNSSAILTPILEAARKDDDPLVKERAAQVLAEQN